MKKNLKQILVFSMLTMALAACGTNNDNNQNPMEPNNGAPEMNEPNDNNVEGQGYNDGETRMEVANDVADQITELEEVQQANVIVTNHHAYVAVMMDDETHDVSDEVKEKISEKAKEADGEIENVHVSANPDFAERLKGYGDRIENGEPIKGMADEFGEMVNRLFPTRE